MNSTRLRFKPSLLLAFVLFLILPAAAQKPQEADKLAQRGAEYLRKNDWRRAAEQYQRAVRANPNHAEAQYGLGAAYVGLGQQSEALEAFSQVVRLKPNPRVAEALVQSGIIHAGAKRYQEAVSSFEQARQLGDIPPAAHFFLAGTYLQLGGRDRDALASFERAAAEQRFAAESYRGIGFIRLKQNETKEAADALARSVQLNPRDGFAQALYGNALLTQGRDEEAMAALRQAVSIDPSQPFAHYALGYAQLSLGQAETAAASFRAALRLQPTAEALAGLGRALMSHPVNRFEDARAAIDQALGMNPRSADALLAMCYYHYVRGQYQHLVETAQQAAQLQPQTAAALTMLGAAVSIPGRMQDGIKPVREAVRLEPNNHWPRHVLAFIYARLDRSQEALAEAREAVRLRPSAPESRNLLSYVLGQLGQHEESLREAQEALRLKRDPADEGWAHYNVAYALSRMNRRDEAAQSYRQSLAAYNQVKRTLDPDDLYLMGNAYIRLEQEQQAVAELR
ncbi:MAG TPA: tetratricopeptide repeat protein, partial [Pyrinomonadaceae bacterium]|nr:tetratricopeptide repeat protein [Pyrinomonadaceae bacterium]